MNSSLNNSLPAMHSEQNIGMVNQTGRVLSNNNEVRGRNATLSNNSSREPSMVSSGRSTPYCDRMDMDLDEVPVVGAVNIGSPELSYETEQDKAFRLGKATDLEINTRPTGGNNEATPMNGIHEDDTINIQLPYDPRPQPNRNCGVDLSSPFLCTAQSSISHLTPRTSKPRSTSWLNISRANE